MINQNIPANAISDAIKLGRDAARVELHTVTALSSGLVKMSPEMHGALSTACEALSTALDGEPPEVSAIREALGGMIVPLNQACAKGVFAITESNVAIKLRDGIAAAATYARTIIESPESALPGEPANDALLPPSPTDTAGRRSL